MKMILLVIFVPILVFMLPFGVEAARLTSSDFTYLGAFRTPISSGTMESVGTTEGYGSLSFRPDGNGGAGSLIIAGRNGVTEITIPTPGTSSNLNSLSVATVIQSTTDIATGGSLGSCDRLGSVAYVGQKGSVSPKLYWSCYIYYNVAGDDYSSLGWSEVTMSSPKAKGAWHIGPSSGGNWDSPYHGNKYGSYIIPIDQAWADQYTGGKSLLVGRYKEAGSAGGSMGPVLTAVGPWLDGNPPANGSNLSATPLMYFNSVSVHTGDTTWMEFRLTGDPNYTYYSAGDHWNGGAWVTVGTKKALVLVGRHGTYDGSNPCPWNGANGCNGAVGTNTPPYCYGEGGKDCPYGIAVTNYKGYHNGPYRGRFLFIDPDDLALVAQGQKDAHSVDAYAVYAPQADWQFDSTEGLNQIVGAAYDSTNHRFYVVQAMVEQPGGQNAPAWPLIHVYQVSDSGSGPGKPRPPQNLRLVNP